MNIENLEFKQVRNKDFKEVILEAHGIPILKIALAYGFRNIQNIVRKIKTKKCEYDYVEIMACPGGWLNGGGQIKPKELNISPSDLLENLASIQQQSLEIVESENVLGLMSLYSNIEQEEVMGMTKTAFSVIKREASVGNLKW